MNTGIIIAIVLMIGFFILVAIVQANMTPEERANALETGQHGVENPHMICPHCQTRGKIRTKSISHKKKKKELAAVRQRPEY